MQEIKCPKCGEVFKVDEAGYAAIVSQIKNKEFTKEIDERVKQINDSKNKDIELLKGNFKAEQEKAELEYKHKIEDLEKQIELNKTVYTAEKEKAIEEIKQENIKLKSQIDSNEKDKTIAISAALEKAKEELNKKEQEIITLKGNIENAKIAEEALKERHKNELKYKDDVIASYKDFKAKLSTKMLGETLEQHCLAEFNKYHMMGAFPNAIFEKDNDAKAGETKGDFIFKDFYDGIEYVSIMFEMKNEMETTTTKQKNEEFFKKLDKDRKEKGCKYAVLVSMLESENEFYNNGIVDVSFKTGYKDMYVIRPQFFIPIISLLRNSAFDTLEYQKRIVEYENQNIDIINFENKLLKFRDGFGKNYDSAKKNFEEAIKDIDKAIKNLQDVKESLETSKNQLRLANDKLQGITIKKLISGNPTMTEKFKEAEKNKKENKQENNDDAFLKMEEKIEKIENKLEQNKEEN